MDPAVKTALAFCVLLVGYCEATLLRGDKPKLPPPEPVAVEPLSIRAQTKPPQRRCGPGAGERNGLPTCPTSRGRHTSDDRRAAVGVTPSDRREPPPPLAPDYPPSRSSAQHRWGPSMGAMLPGGTPRTQATHTHKIVDGDTLPALAEPY